VCSLVGTLFLTYAGLCRADKIFKADAMLVSMKHRVLLNWCVAGGTLLGVVVQYLLEKRRQRQEENRAIRAEQERRTLEDRARRQSSAAKSTPWWNWVTGGKF